MASDGIFDGDLVIVDPQATFMDGKIYAVRIDSQEIAARKVYTAGSRRFKLVSGDGDAAEFGSVTALTRSILTRSTASSLEHPREE